MRMLTHRFHRDAMTEDPYTLPSPRSIDLINFRFPAWNGTPLTTASSFLDPMMSMSKCGTPTGPGGLLLQESVDAYGWCADCRWHGNGRWDHASRVWLCRRWARTVLSASAARMQPSGFATWTRVHVPIRYMATHVLHDEAFGLETTNFRFIQVAVRLAFFAKRLGASGCRDGQLRLWDIRQSGCLHVFNLHQSAQEVASQKGNTEGAVHRGMITDLVQSPDGRLLISAGTDSCLIVWDTLHLTRLFVQFPNAFNRSIRNRQLSMSEDGRLLFFPSGSALHVRDSFQMGDRQLCLWRDYRYTMWRMET